jgi:hypothetical protein
MAKKVLIGAIVVVVLVAIFLFNSNLFKTSGNVVKESNENIVEQNNEIVNPVPAETLGDGCPLEINRDYFYGLRYGNAYLDSKLKVHGIFSNYEGNITGYFLEGDSEGQSPYYMYSNSEMMYERLEKIDEDGFIEKEKWGMNLIYNYTSCESLGWFGVTKVQEMYRCWSKECYEAFICKLVSLNCSKL